MVTIKNVKVTDQAHVHYVKSSTPFSSLTSLYIKYFSKFTAAL